ncbi:MAG TPA: recombinase RecT [Candidatus Saccharimonadia bacterium]|nr:recombinase RecT [Candidatus Saccharimonadia bacterium]
MTTTALAQRQDILPDAQSWKTMMEMARELVASGLLPKGIDKPAAALAVIQKGREIGIPPMYALSNIGIINGRPVVGAEVMLAMVYRDHGDQAIQFVETSAQRCAVSYKRKSWPQARAFEWTMENAEQAGLLGKGGPWKQYPAAMLRARCISAVARLAFPDSLGGMYTPEELGAEVTVTDDGEIEVVPQAAPIRAIRPEIGDVTPPPPQPAGAEFRQKWDQQWSVGIAAATAAGLGEPQAPPANASEVALKKAARELSDEIQARRALNAEIVEKIAQVRATHGANAVSDFDPVTEASETVHQMLATLNEMLAEPEAKDAEAF